MAAHSEIIGNEVYVWMNGHLLYKKWLNTTQSALFTLNPRFVYNKNTLLSIIDTNLPNYLIKKYCIKISDPLL